MSVFVVFYESVEQLKSFADEADITIPLLSDEGSRIITEVGLLNTTLDESNGIFYGIPFPGAFVVGSEGRVTAKFFEQHSLVRTHPSTLLRAAQGLEVAATPPRTEPVAEVEAHVELSEASLRTMLITELFVDLRVPPGQHLYGEPVSDGLVATSVSVDGSSRLTVHPAQLPPTSPMTLAGTGETLHVYDGDVRIRVPVVYNGRPVEPDDNGVDTLEITGTIRWQSCDDHSCNIPRTETFSLRVPVRPPNVPGMLAKIAPPEEALDE